MVFPHFLQRCSDTKRRLRNRKPTTLRIKGCQLKTPKMSTTGVPAYYQTNRQKASPFVNYYHQNLYSTQPHQPLNLYNSEWRSPTNTPTKEMATITSTVGVAEAENDPRTPSKYYVTPARDKIVKSEEKNDDARDSGGLSGISSGPGFGPGSGPGSGPGTGPTSSTSGPLPMDILWGMLNTIVGKDKMAKVGQYTLRLLLYHASKSQEYLSDESINIDVINLRYYDRTAKLSLLQNFLKHPANFLRIVIILFCSIFSSRLTPLVGGLAMYRQFLRFGKTPFRVRTLTRQISATVTKDNKIELSKVRDLMTRKTLGDLFSLYYGVHDEILLLFKLKFFTSKSLQQYAARHESRAWYYETLLALYNTYERLQQLSQQEMDMRIQIQVKQRAKLLSKQLLGGSQLLNSSHHEDPTDLNQLKDIQFKKYNAYIDIYKWLADFAFNTYTVFNLKLPFDTFQIWMGITASLLSSAKLYRETNKKLLEKQLAAH